MKTRTIFLTTGAGSMLLFAYIAARTDQNVNTNAIQISPNSLNQRESTRNLTDQPLLTDPSRGLEDRDRISSERTARAPHLLGGNEARSALVQAMAQTRTKSLRSSKSSSIPLPASMVISDQALIPDSQEANLTKLAQQFQSDIGKEITSPRTDTMDADYWLDAKEQSDLQFRIRYGKQAWLSHHIAAQHLLLQGQDR